MIQHIEFTIKFDLTCDGEKEDFEIVTDSSIEESVIHYILDCPEKLIDSLKINKVWYEEDKRKE